MRQPLVAMPPPMNDEVVEDDEAQTTMSCLPIASLYKPVQVGQLG